MHILFMYIYFKQYLVRGVQFSEAGLNRALMKKKIRKMVQLSITKVMEGQLGLDLKCL